MSGAVAEPYCAWRSRCGLSGAGARVRWLCLAGAIALNTEASPQSGTVTFTDACTAGDRIVIAAVGDLIFQAPIQKQIDEGRRSYRSLWQNVEPALAGADIVYGNLEGPVARTPGDRSDRGFLSFNYSAHLLDDLWASGFHVLSTANNHALDRGTLGIDRTIDALMASGLAYTGTRKSTGSSTRWNTVIHVRGMRIAWVACTYGTNGLVDRLDQVLKCFDPSGEVLNEISRLANDPAIAAVIFTPHWGLEDTTLLDPDQMELARRAIDAGALAVIGTHPHVLQAWEKLPSPQGGDGIVIYSTGNFISAQPSAEQRTGAIVRLELVKPTGASRARLAGANYILTKIADAPSYTVEESEDHWSPPHVPAGNRVRSSAAVITPRCHTFRSGGN
jgi:poly-gamma-glutamate capsule biosynthesis protein CapA/YwtB (metallophosphatase superfamily)